MIRELGGSCGGSVKAVGVDDGYFPIKCKELRCRTIVAVVLCEGLTPVDVTIEPVTVDGLDGTEAAARSVRRLASAPQIIFTDGVTVAGFNIIDPEALSREVSVPVIAVFKHELSLSKIRVALEKHFTDWRVRFDVIRRVYGASKPLVTPWRKIRVSVFGMDLSRALDAIIALQNTSPLPEPLRLADIIASGLTRGSPLLGLLNPNLLGADHGNLHPR